MPVLLEAALDADDGTVADRMAVLADLPAAGDRQDLAAGLRKAEGKARLVLIELAGRRPIAAAVPALLKAADDADGRSAPRP